MPVQVYAIAEWVQLAACDRGAGIWASTWNKPVDESTAMYTACLDKDGRMDVPRVVPDGGFEHVKHPLVVGFSEAKIRQMLNSKLKLNTVNDNPPKELQKVD